MNYQLVKHQLFLLKASHRLRNHLWITSNIVIKIILGLRQSNRQNIVISCSRDVAGIINLFFFIHVTNLYSHFIAFKTKKLICNHQFGGCEQILFFRERGIWGRGG